MNWLTFYGVKSFSLFGRVVGSEILYFITFAESEPYCHSILFVCLSGCLSVIPRPTAYHNGSITTKFGWTCVSLFGSPVSHTFGARGKNM